MLYRNHKKAAVIGVPCDLGAGLRGANMGPASLRVSEIKRKIECLGYNVSDYGNVDVPIREGLPITSVQARYVEEIAAVCLQVAAQVGRALSEQRVPLVLGGDHSLAIGSVRGVGEFFHPKKIGLVWIDAHADLNTPETTETANVHGMPLSVLMGEGDPRLVGSSKFNLDPSNIALIGIRTLDPEEAKICLNCGIRYFTMREIDERGLAKIMREAIGVATKGTEAIHVSFDIDAIDPTHAPGVSTAVMGGLTYREAHLALEMLSESDKVCSFDLVELNPMRDVANRTAQLGVELAQSILGKTIL